MGAPTTHHVTAVPWALKQEWDSAQGREQLQIKSAEAS